MQLNQPETIEGMEDCRFALRALETEAYSSIVNAFRARGPFSEYYRLILEHIRLILDVSIDRHKAEIRRAIADPTLLKIATELNPKTDVTFEWIEESKRISGHSNFPSSLAMDSPSFYRFQFLRTCKNDLLLDLADNLALLAVQHNRSKSIDNGEESAFEVLRRPKSLKLEPEKTQEKLVGSANTQKIREVAEAKTPETTGLVNSGRGKNQGGKRKSTQKESDSVASTPVNVSPINRKPPKKSVGRPKKQTATVQITKPRLGQIIAARSAVVARGASALHNRGGRGGKKFTMTKVAPIVTSPQRTPGPAGHQSYYNEASPKMLTVYSQKTVPRTPPRPFSQLTPSTPPVVNNQPFGPASAQKTLSGRQIRKRPAFTGRPAQGWTPGQYDPSKSMSNSAGSRVPVSPLSVMLPAVGSSVTSKVIPTATSRFFPPPSSPTRQSLTGDAPGVYADDYNANVVDTAVSSLNAASDSPMQPHQFLPAFPSAKFGHASPAKTRRYSPTGSSASSHGQQLLGHLPSPRVQAFMAKPKSTATAAAAAAASAMIEMSAGISNAKTGGNGNSTVGLGSATLPVRQSSGQKLIVLPSRMFRGTQPGGPRPPSHHSETAKPASITGEGPAKQQSVIIVRRAPSLPSAMTSASTSSIVSSASSSISTPATTPTPSTSTPPELTPEVHK